MFGWSGVSAAANEGAKKTQQKRAAAALMKKVGFGILVE
ncbi:hypothetical protein RISK_003871 [Rhodopirellula islandica]|uniref:Uncharacterized protein n=1 Tax=Rhodopirellula islandica TaxID=595434 RepID=A0A0J1BCC3_RHOIS|nr:hypothetical protein RISK_003871 [Rhodopirellula islandica]